MSDAEYDVVVAGARVAGSTLAALLGDAGYRVLLVDRATFPSPTLSTHFFRGGQAVAVLQRLGVLNDVLALGCPPLTCQYSYEGGISAATINPPQAPGEIGYCLSVRREALDHILVRRAMATSHVDLLERTRVADLLRAGDHVAGVRLMTPEGERSVGARIVVGADGRHSLVARAVDAPIEECAPACRAIYYCYVSGYSGPHGGTPDGPEFSRLEDEIAYVFPSDAGLTCIALSINLAEYSAFRKDAEASFREHISRHRGIAERFAAATWTSRLLGCGPEANWVRVPAGSGWVLVGDAGMHQDPWSGQGIDMATRHAEFLADVLIDSLNGKAPEAEALGGYHRRRNEHGVETWRMTVSLARDLRQLDAAGDA